MSHLDKQMKLFTVLIYYEYSFANSFAEYINSKYLLYYILPIITILPIHYQFSQSFLLVVIVASNIDLTVYSI